ncbi:hypothetical protein PTSG_02336 [Salpingoeca rosetta]|uniref:Sulfotransferase domain-containing protein n=1 Tax=Salpingoeca rosetta (strain ATCC 50818 / BSB-021) TaxID=946362 RepID=F2U1W7_SALR5|nr:uncharacterized protein PTSG_02336 [Salpingoeca rosetta]EGD81619.1 hypothetical protein PTSG_02336 [Salpingoeca rosetta]|eukprot:XP_004996823.1 hypothetical protein PTSG_02336 [Salpingoeca rosetta]
MPRDQYSYKNFSSAASSHSSRFGSSSSSGGSSGTNSDDDGTRSHRSTLRGGSKDRLRGAAAILNHGRLGWACVLVFICVVGGLFYVNSVLSSSGLKWGDIDTNMIQKYKKRFSLKPDMSFGDFCDAVPPVQSKPPAAKPYDGSHIILLSFPRSGNHLARGVIECLIDTPTFGYPKEKHFVTLERHMQHEEASAKASKRRPFVRKLHGMLKLPERWDEYEYGLIYQVRDPVEAVLSENRNSPYFWRQYHDDMTRIMQNTATFLSKPRNHRALLYFEDYYRDPMINIRKLQHFFGKDIVSDERAEYCNQAYRNISSTSKSHLQRSSHTHALNQYARAEFGDDHPQVYLQPSLYEVMSRYPYFHSCDQDSEDSAAANANANNNSTASAQDASSSTDPSLGLLIITTTITINYELRSFL